MESPTPQNHQVTIRRLGNIPTKALFFSLIKQEISGTPHQTPQPIQFSQLRHPLTRPFKPFPTNPLFALLIKQEISGK
jgi:hypothetical protein